MRARSSPDSSPDWTPAPVRHRPVLSSSSARQWPVRVPSVALRFLVIGSSAFNRFFPALCGPPLPRFYPQPGRPVARLTPASAQIPSHRHRWPTARNGADSRPFQPKLALVHSVFRCEIPFQISLGTNARTTTYINACTTLIMCGVITTRTPARTTAYIDARIDARIDACTTLIRGRPNSRVTRGHLAGTVN